MNKIASKTIFAASILLAGLAPSALQGAAVIYESFSTFPDASLNGNAGGTGLTGNWTAGNQWVEGTNSTYGSLPTIGSSVTVTGGWANANVAVDTTAAYTSLLAGGGEMWFSATVSLTAIDGRFGFALSNDGIGLSNGGLTSAGGIGFGITPEEKIYAKAWDTTTWDGGGLTSAPPGSTGGAAVANNGSTIFVVGKVEWGATGTDLDTVSLYLPGTNLALGSVVASDSGVLNQSTFDTLGFSSLRSGNYIDEIRFGATMADVGVVPEPSTALLGVLGMLLLLRRHRD